MPSIKFRTETVDPAEERARREAVAAVRRQAAQAKVAKATEMEYARAAVAQRRSALEMHDRRTASLTGNAAVIAAEQRVTIAASLERGERRARELGVA